MAEINCFINELFTFFITHGVVKTKYVKSWKRRS